MHLFNSSTGIYRDFPEEGELPGACGSFRKELIRPGHGARLPFSSRITSLLRLREDPASMPA